MQVGMTHSPGTARGLKILVAALLEPSVRSDGAWFHGNWCGFVSVPAVDAALLAPINARALRLKDCSRQAEWRTVSQECLHQIEASPEDA